jgi:hypothetical protein
MNPHQHRWQGIPVSQGQRRMERCLDCGDVRQLLPTERPGFDREQMWIDEHMNVDPGQASNLAVALAKQQRERDEQIRAAKLHDMVGSHGGIVGYDSRTNLVQTADGSTFSAEALASVNHVSVTDVEKMLKRSLVRNKVVGGPLSAFDALGRERMGPYFDGETPKPRPKVSPDAALKIILDTITSAPDVFKAKGEWLTKITIAISGISDDTENDDE